MGLLLPASWPAVLPHAIPTLIIVTIVAYAAKCVRSWYRLRHIPGPRLAAWSSWWQLREVLGGRSHESFQRLADRYGPLVRIGPNELLSTDPVTLRKVSAVRGEYIKGKYYISGRVVPGVDNVVSLRDEAEHKAMRAKMMPGYSPKENQGYSFEASIDRQLKKFISLLDRKYISTSDQHRPLDFAQKTQFFALDAIGDISFGEPFGYLDHDEDLYQYNEINKSSLPVMNLVSALPWLVELVHKWPLNLILPREDDQVGFGRLMGIAKELVQKRLMSGALSAQDMMHAHINSGMNEEELIQQAIISTVAGSNSSAHGIRMTILSLITNPPTYRALIAEIHKTQGSVSSPISWSEIQNMPYLQACVREGLRMHPPVGGLGFKQVPASGDTLNGFFVPGGTQIGQGYQAVGRSKLVWGDDADVFQPERWLAAEGETLRTMLDAWDTHFGHGKFSCLGKPIAVMEIQKAVYELMKRYDFSVVNTERPIKTELAVFLYASDFWVRITKREAHDI